ncbi:hypothetical protein [Candidatus Thiosymbion oneisti]|uniref:hypothetical protein n=1 Tax=Candidatus Thiosymbion oneisti TaxID=589554 RepID=UPI00114CFC32|nr:hypothetical protein [Candidatus Thiosymbion oneisti]
MRIGIYEEMRERLRGFSIVDCSIRSRDCIYILFQNPPYRDDEDVDILFRAGFYYPKTERIWGYDAFRNVYKAKSCVLPPPNGPIVVVDFDGQVISQTGDTNSGSGFDFEEPIPLIPNVSVLRVREIAGQAYIAGTLRTVFRREGPGDWTCLSGNDLAVRDEEDRQGWDFGFEDIDGFAADDLYACGGKGDLCHYDGRHWEVIDCPTNQYLAAICCAGNGKVYVGGKDGMLIEGRGDLWQVVGEDTEGFSVPGGREYAGMGARIRCMAWYRDRLYMATNQGVWEYFEGRVRRTPGLAGLVPNPGEEGPEPKINERVQKLLRAGGASEEAIDLVSMPVSIEGEGILAPAALHSLSTDGELLLLGGGDKVAVFDGVKWKILYAPYGIDSGGSL